MNFNGFSEEIYVFSFFAARSARAKARNTGEDFPYLIIYIARKKEQIGKSFRAVRLSGRRVYGRKDALSAGVQGPGSKNLKYFHLFPLKLSR